MTQIWKLVLLICLNFAFLKCENSEINEECKMEKKLEKMKYQLEELEQNDSDMDEKLEGIVRGLEESTAKCSGVVEKLELLKPLLEAMSGDEDGTEIEYETRELEGANPLSIQMDKTQEEIIAAVETYANKIYDIQSSLIDVLEAQTLVLRETRKTNSRNFEEIEEKLAPVQTLHEISKLVKLTSRKVEEFSEILSENSNFQPKTFEKPPKVDVDNPKIGCDMSEIEKILKNEFYSIKNEILKLSTPATNTPKNKPESDGKNRKILVRSAKIVKDVNSLAEKLNATSDFTKLARNFTESLVIGSKVTTSTWIVADQLAVELRRFRTSTKLAMLDLVETASELDELLKEASNE